MKTLSLSIYVVDLLLPLLDRISTESYDSLEKHNLVLLDSDHAMD